MDCLSDKQKLELEQVIKSCSMTETEEEKRNNNLSDESSEGSS